MVLARVPPVQFLATARATMYARVKASRLRGNVIPPRTMASWRERARRRAIEVWRDHLLKNPPTVGTRVLEAVLPHLEEWVDRPWSGLSYRMTQVLTGHGCFGEYLCRIGKEPTTHCHHCDAKRDSAQHTLEHCPAWDELRRVLKDKIGEDLSLGAVVAKMVLRESCWKAGASFCEQVMLQKEAAETARERQRGGRPGAGSRQR
ncbi:uncharacterized protein LOC113004638 [Solenopsis invicta]|uniref:uncharacterized protein LOC113004638 n=1 Tax=Solenopsis invicta TaxID=13686 RepID=UPI000E33DAF1|nr:uncharacterized protein LOC113004638 [Solenopsis invicta]